MKKETEAKQVLLINDMPGYGKVALAAMVPILSRMGHYLYQLPTAAVSNTLDFGKFYIQDMTEYMTGTIQVWEELGFEPDCICTGFIVSEEQARLLKGYILAKKERNAKLVIVDPIMGDGGHLYNGVGPERIEAMKQLAAVSDVMIPNITEAGYLTGIVRNGGVAEAGTRAEIRILVDGLRALSGKSVVITSVIEAETKKHLVCGFDHNQERYFSVEYEYLPARIAGSGDIFSSVLTGELLHGQTLKAGVEKAVKILSQLIKASDGQRDNYKGIIVEKYWEIFEQQS